MRPVTTFTSAFLAAATLTGCTSAPAQPPPGSAPEERLRTEVVEVLAHDPAAFTQGLELVDGVLYEGTGLVGSSSIRSGPPGLPPTTRVPLDAGLFGEGITVAGPTLWQLTWTDGFAIRRDAATLAERERVPFDGEGWGLCHQDGRDRLVMSDGSGTLTFRDPRTFAPTGTLEVRSAAGPVDELNELECVGEEVYANVWQTDTVLRIDSATGAVTARIDASGLLSEAEQAQADVLNGIAAVAGTDQFLLTGKLWPKMFRTRLVPSG
ncbi:glutaminyl-peptide cyclotransferase [Amycolatopsis antarctica]|uniref:Glutaminyl-peptide cyclotransferase n=1 Tax=Amycolatopsis antarctica TaxID=1854586 RepID=A0A263CZ06_9PSEU|nr:glutaminyl-peptide cyclotransferase [Amycolatopsis antarctica]OZM70647.1 glutaminyl-peptide cyclotransferase [Amycolatopsis antarctica]